MKWSGWFVASFLVVAACGDEIDPGSRVLDFRLLAVQADKPYAAPGEEVKVTTLTHEPFGRAITYGWAACSRPDSTSANCCIDKLVEDSKTTGKSPFVSIGTDPTFVTTIPTN